MASRKILVVDDEKDILRLLHYSLKQEGYQVYKATSGERGLALAKKNKPDLIVLDIMLPHMDGLEFCRRLLAKGTHTPAILLLSAKASELDRILGLKLGADDYVTKPFSVKELAARVEAILRRTTAPPKKDVGILHTGEIKVHQSRHEVKVKGKVIVLTPTEYDLLNLLLEAGGDVLSRNDFLKRLWNDSKNSDFSTRTVDQHIGKLRRKLGREGKFIVTVSKLGYRIKMT